MKAKFITGILAIAALTACGNSKTATADSSSAEATATGIIGQWNINRIVLDDTTKIIVAETTPGIRQYITFEDSTYSIRTNCNSISGDYYLNGDTIILGDGPMTEMACDNMQTEDALRVILPFITTVEFDSDSTMRLKGATPSQFIELTKYNGI